jgi:hypothetical protein
MDTHRLDQLARAVGGAHSRRRALQLLAGGVAGPVLALLGQGDAVAACRTFEQTCESGQDCCDGLGLRCRKGRCRCQNGWKHCQAGPGCQNLKSDEDHCGTCGNECSGAARCCYNGTCEPTCGDTNTCCGDCFTAVDEGDPVPDPEEAICCQEAGGTVCSKKSGPGDDRCCYGDEKCLKGFCCNKNGKWGETICGSRCCRKAACCNGQCLRHEAGRLEAVVRRRQPELPEQFRLLWRGNMPGRQVLLGRPRMLRQRGPSLLPCGRILRVPGQPRDRDLRHCPHLHQHVSPASRPAVSAGPRSSLPAATA